MPDKDQLHRCVRSVTLQGIDSGLPVHEAFDRAFGICKGNLINAGWLIAGSYRSETPSPAGKKRIKEMRKEPDHQGKLAEYEALREEAKASRARASGRSRGPELAAKARLLKATAALEQARARRQTPLEQALVGAANRSTSWMKDEVVALRKAMDPVFSCDTVFGDCKWPKYPSAGHCFMAALAVQDLLGGEILYGEVNDISHYWNRVGEYQVDITADQFDQKPIQVKKGSIRPHIAVFDRKRYERPRPQQNAEAMKIYDRFRKKLVEELEQRDLDTYVSHLEKMP